MGEVAEKWCRVCEETKPITEFYGNRKNRDGVQTYCKKCQNRKRNEWARAHPEKNRAWNRNYYDRLTPEKKRDTELRSKFGITLARYNEMLSDQNYVCAVCEREPKPGVSLQVDHDHACCPGSRYGGCGNCVRGLLCLNCNAALGHVNDDPQRLERLITYLNR